MEGVVLGDSHRSGREEAYPDFLWQGYVSEKAGCQRAGEEAALGMLGNNYVSRYFVVSGK